MHRTLLLALTVALAAGCNGSVALSPSRGAEGPTAAPAAGPADGRPFVATEFARFDEPWAMTFLPDGRVLVTEKRGSLKLFDPATKTMGEITGVPEVDHGGQGGLGDIVLHPRFAQDGTVWFSHAEAGERGTRGAVVASARLVLEGSGGRLEDVRRVWTQLPKVEGRGHYSHRIAFSPDGNYAFISSGERQKFDPAQDMASNMGKIIRLNADGSLPPDNPFAAQGDVAAQVWTLGHRNILGLAFDAGGQLWNHEMGPKGGDELNRVVPGDNYGYPIVSDGDHYDGRDIPDHATRPEFHKPAVTWTPVISPSSLVFYSGAMFPAWQGQALIGGLSSQALVVVKAEGETAAETARYDMGERIREVEQGPDGALWLLEDGDDARLLKLTPSGSPAR